MSGEAAPKDGAPRRSHREVARWVIASEAAAVAGLVEQLDEGSTARSS